MIIISKKELYRTIHEILNEWVDKYVLVDDRDDAIIGTYVNGSSKEDAIEDARSMGEADPYGSYSVYKAGLDGGFDRQERVYTTYNEGKQQVGRIIKENIVDIVNSLHCNKK